MNTSAAALLNADYMSGAVSESLRLAAASSPAVQRVPVRPFAKPNYRDGQGESTDRHLRRARVSCAMPPAFQFLRRVCCPPPARFHVA